MSEQPGPAYVEDEDPRTGDGDRGTRLTALGANSGARRTEAVSKDNEVKPSRASVSLDSGVSGLSRPSNEGVEKDRSAESVGNLRRQAESPLHQKEEQPSTKKPDTSQHSRRESKERSLDKSVKRRETKSKKAESAQSRECTDPNCKRCLPSLIRHQPRRLSLDGNINPTYSRFAQAQHTLRQQYPGYPSASARPVPTTAYEHPLLPGHHGVSTAPRYTGYYMSAQAMAPPTMEYHEPRPSHPAAYFTQRPPRDEFIATHHLPEYREQSSAPLPKQYYQALLHNVVPQSRPSLSRPMVDPGLDYSTRTSERPPADLTPHNRSQDPYTSDESDITIHPAHFYRESFHTEFPRRHSQTETPESSPERPLALPFLSNRGREQPPLLKSARRPLMTHSARTFDAVPQHFASNHVDLDPRARDSPSDQYDTHVSTKAMVPMSRPHRRSMSRRAEYPNHSRPTTPPYSSRPEQVSSPQRAPDPLRRSSIYRAPSPPAGPIRDAEAIARRYQDAVSGFKDNPALMSADALRKEAHRRSFTGVTPSHTSGDGSHRSHRSHRSKASISSRASATKGNLLLQYGNVIVDLPAAAEHRASIVPRADGGPGKLIIELGKGAETRDSVTRHGDSVKSSAKMSSGRRSETTREESQTESRREYGMGDRESWHRRDSNGDVGLGRRHESRH